MLKAIFYDVCCRCVSRNSAGETSTSHRLKLIPPQWKVNLNPDLHVANLGSMVKFECWVSVQQENYSDMDLNGKNKIKNLFYKKG